MVPGHTKFESDLVSSTMANRCCTSDVFNTCELVSIDQACGVIAAEPLPVHLQKWKESITPCFSEIRELRSRTYFRLYENSSGHFQTERYIYLGREVPQTIS